MSQFSFVTSPVEALSETGDVICKGTAFFYKRTREYLYLVTNWHVVTDRSPNMPRKVNHGAVPVKLRLLLHKNIGPNTFRLSEKIVYEIPLNDSEGSSPTWLEHPSFRFNCDVVVLRIPVAEGLSERATFSFLDEDPELEPGLMPEPMADAFVIGYPWGHSSGDGVIPLYKRGNVASDPRLNHGGMPRFLIDCRTASGMSGAPVLIRHSGLWLGGAVLNDASTFGTIINFVGVYSGRLMPLDDTSRETREISELGIVWKKTALDQVVDNGVAGTPLSGL